ncbi:MAG: hypothetical protein BroJett018_52680 [Chloroflexota bacterium]|nr:MAG: hypothetical protein BroJett018_52680 [Chloroflexota bacterium]
MTERDFVADMNHSLAFAFKHEDFPQTKGQYRRRVNAVTEARITTYEQAYTVLSDPHAHDALHIALLVVLWNIYLSRSHPDEGILDRHRLVIPLTHTLASGNWRVRDWALKIVRLLDLTETAQTLQKLMRTDRSERVRRHAMRILAEMGDEDAIELSITLAREFLAHRPNAYHIRKRAAETLTDYADRPHVLQTLLDTMLDTTESSDIRCFTARWLAHEAIPSTVPAYLHLLSEPDIEVRFSAAEGLASMVNSIEVSNVLPQFD